MCQCCVSFTRLGSFIGGGSSSCRGNEQGLVVDFKYIRAKALLLKKAKFKCSNKEIENTDIFNFDQVPRCFEREPKSTITNKGRCGVKLKKEILMNKDHCKKIQQNNLNFIRPNQKILRADHYCGL
jgi:hypothetical protein